MTDDEFLLELNKHRNYKFETIHGMDFYKLDLSDIKFIHGRFIACEFNRVTSMVYSSFYGSVFESCKFENITVYDCDFRKCELEKSYFKNCKFINCNFTEANMYSSKLINCTFENCDFTSANLYYIKRWGVTYFEDCNLEDVKSECLDQLPVKETK